MLLVGAVLPNGCENSTVNLASARGSSLSTGHGVDQTVTLSEAPWL